jgi:hypothetical protein
MTTNEYARKVAELIDARPRHIDLDKLLHEIYVLANIAEGRVGRNGRQKNSKTVEYAQKIVEHIKARPRGINLDQLLDAISFHAEIAESERDIQAGRVVTHEQAMEEMWKLIYSKLNGQNGRAKNMQKSSIKSRKMRR